MKIAHVCNCKFLFLALLLVKLGVWADTYHEEMITCFSPRRVRAWVKAPIEAMGIDPTQPFVLKDLLSGKDIRFQPDSSVRSEEGEIMVITHLGDACLLQAVPGAK